MLTQTNQLTLDGRLFDSDLRNTPKMLLRKINKVLGDISLDPCTTLDNPINALHFIAADENDDGLSFWWGDFPTIYLNPPLGGATFFVAKLLQTLADVESKTEVAIAAINYNQHLSGNLELLKWASFLVFPYERIQWEYQEKGQFCEDLTVIALFTKADYLTKKEVDFYDFDLYKRAMKYRSRFESEFSNIGLLVKPEETE
jgi:hypothetical protein